MFLPSAPRPDSAQLAYAHWQANDELSRQKAIVRARQYYDGQQLTYLTKRLKEKLSLDATVSEDLLFHLNICRQIITAVVERLNVTGFTSDDLTPEQAQAGEPSQADVAEDWWQKNRLDGQQWNAYRAIRRDGEHFEIVDFDSVNGIPRITPHQRYTAPEAFGDGYGVKAIYPMGNPDQPMLYAVKRWTEEYTDANGTSGSRLRQTTYYPDRIEKTVLSGGEWRPFQDEGDATWPLPWVDRAGKPLGIAAIHFKNDELLCEIDSAVVSMQNLLNSTLLDLAESSDQTAFRVYKALGFMPTTDGKPPAADGSNALKIKPNTIVGTTKTPQEAAFDAIPGESPEPLVTIVERIMRWVAIVKDIPLSRLQLSGQIAAEGTLKQQDAPLLSLCRQLQIIIGDAWEDVFYLARRLANLYDNAGLDESVKLTVQWGSPEVRSDDRDDPTSFWTAATSAVQSGVPIKVYLKRMGWTESDLADIPDALAQPAPTGQTALPAGGAGGINPLAALQAQLQPHLADLAAAIKAPGVNGQVTNG